MNLGEAIRAHGLQASLHRDGDFLGPGLVSHDRPRMLVFVESAAWLPAVLGNPSVSAVLTTAELAAELPPRLAIGVTDSPRKAFYLLHNTLVAAGFYRQRVATVIAGSARIHPRAWIAETGVVIGERCVIEPNVTIFEGTVLEDDVVVRAGVVLGSEGFQFPLVDGVLLAVSHAGGVHIGKRVHIQANCCVDRALFGGSTTLGDDTKLDNIVHIAHDCQIGKRNRIAACAMFAGSVRTGDDVWVGPASAISSEVSIGDGAAITIGAVVSRDVPAGRRVTGNLAIDHDRYLAYLRTIR